MNKFIIIPCIVVAWYLIGFISLFLICKLIDGDEEELIGKLITYGKLFEFFGFCSFGPIVFVFLIIMLLGNLYEFITDTYDNIKDKPVSWLNKK